MNKYIVVICTVIAGVVLYWLYSLGKLGSVLPWALIAACPLMHLFMMRGMGHHNHTSHGDSNPDNSAKNDKNQNCH